ncbi:MAG: hypothetical protein ACR2P0_20420 [Acidimicrobiales bacterium]
MTDVEQSRSPGPNLWLAIGVMIAGGAFLAFAGWQAFTSITELLSVDSFPVPGSQSQDLDPGLHEIYTSSPGSLDLDDLVVTNDATGERISVRDVFVVVELDRPGRSYDLTAEFDVETSGHYTLSILGDARGRAIFGPGLISSFQDLGGLVIPAVLGALLLLVGTVMLIVGMVRRRNHRPVIGYAQAAGPPPHAAAPPPITARPGVPPNDFAPPPAPPARVEAPAAPPAEPPEPTPPVESADDELPDHPFGSID